MGALAAGVIGYGVHKLVDHIQQKNRESKMEDLTSQIEKLQSEIDSLENQK